MCIKVPAKSLLLFLALTSLACEATEDNSAAKRGAIGGALIGATMGALTGDAGMAARGAAMGAVAGGVAGSMDDLDNQRENERTQTMADAIAGRTGAEPVPASERPQTWDRLDDFVGTWRCSIWGLDGEGNRVTASSTWTGTLATTRAVRMNLDSIDLQGYDDAVDAQLTGYSQISFSADTGYEILNVFASTPENARWVGELLTGEERYSFFYVGSSEMGALGTPRSDHRIELRFVGRDVILIETFIPGEDGTEVQIQSYRFTRTS